MNKKAINLLLILLMSMVGLQAHADWDTSNKVKVDNLYYYLDEENHQAQVTSMPQGAFYVDPRSIPDNIWYNNQKYSVTSIGPGAFSHCYKLTSVTISNSVTSIGDDAFLNCEKLSEITIPNSVTSIGRHAFMACKELSRIYIPNSVTFIGDGAFIGTDLVSLIVDVNNPKYDSRDNCNAIIETATNKLIRGCRFTVIPNSVTSIGNEAFGNILFDNETFSCIIPNSVTSIGDYAFWDSPLHSITIGNSVTSIGYQAFYECKDLKKVIVPDLAAWCGIEFGNPTANPLYYAHHLYSDKNTEITNLIIPNSVTSIGASAFSGCSGLTSVAIPNSVTSISSGAFSGCTGLTSINVDANNPKYDSRDNCNAIIEKGTNTLVVGCKNSVIPSSVTNIGNYAFYGCSGLTSVTIPNSVTSIGGGAFADCKGLTSVKVYAKTPPTAGYNAFPTNQTITLYVPRGSKAAYETADIWKDFSSIVEFGIAVTANDLTMAYGDAVPELTYKTEGGSVTGTPQITCEATSTSPVGTYPIVISKGTIDSDEVTYVDGTLTIKKAPLTIKAKSYTIKQGEALPAFEAEYSGFKNSETSSVLTTQPTITTTATSASAPGTYDITISGATATNYNITHVKGTLTITNADADPVTVTATSYSRQYGEANPAFEYTSTGAALSGTPSITCSATATSPVGEYPIVITKGTVTNYNDTYVNGTLTITKAPLTITAKSYTIKQGDALPSFEAEYAGFKNSETSDVLTTQPTITTTATSASAPGAYDIVISGASATNYDITHVKGTLTIAPPSAEFVTVAAKSYSRMYGEANPTFEYTTAGASLSGTPSITCDATATSPVGEYDIVVSKGTVTNKYVAYVNGKLTITKAPLTITAKSYTIKQGEKLPKFEVEYSGFKNNETEVVLTKKPTITTSATSSSEPGTYDIVVSGASATNYDISYVNGTLTIDGGINGVFYEFNGDEATVVDNPSKYQGNVVIPASVNYNGKEYSVTSIGSGAFSDCYGLTSITIGNSVTSIGNYAFGACRSLTSIAIPNSVISIGKEAFSVCSGLTSIAIPNSVISIGEKAFLGCSGLTSITIGNSLTSIGDYVFHICTELTSINIDVNNPKYDSRDNCNAIIEKETNRLVVGCKNTVIPNSVTSIGGSAFYGCSGLTSIEIPSSVTFIGGEAFWGCSGLTSVKVFAQKPPVIYSRVFPSNQTITLYVPRGSKAAYEAELYWKVFSSIVEFDLPEEPFTVTANDLTMVYGDAVPELTYKTEGATFTGTPQITCEATSTSPVGIYPIVISQGTIDNNNGTYVNGTLTITKAPLKITAKCYTIKQGDALPTFEAEYAGFKNNETDAVLAKKPTITTTATSASEPGTYDIVVSGAEAGNYDITYVKGTLTITKADEVVVTAKSYSRKYGEANPTFEFTTSGAALTGTPAITCEATATSAVGEYDIVVSKGSVTNYNVTYVNGKLTITKAPLTITAKSYTIKQGDALPTFEAEYAGFKNNETDAVLTKKPTITTTATSASAPGTYEIVVADASATNYDITYVKGTLTITKADEVVVTAKSYSRKYGEANPTFEYTTSGATLTGTPSISCSATATSPVGEYDIVVSKGSVTNYNVTFVNGKLTVTKAPLTITAKSYTIKQGDALPTFEAEYAGFKNNETSSVLSSQPRITTTATSTDVAGEYDINVSGAEAQNYDISYVKGKLIIEKVDVDPITETETTTFSSEMNESTDLSNTVIGNTYYSMNADNGDGYDATEQAIVLNSTTTADQMNTVQNATMGNAAIKQNFNGIIFEIAAGTGAVYVDVKTKGTHVLKVQFGKGTPTTITKTARETVGIDYNVSEPTYVYLYASTASGGSAPLKRASAGANSVLLYGYKITPGSNTGIGVLTVDDMENGSWYTIDGRKLQSKPTTKGLYIINGRKVVVK